MRRKINIIVSSAVASRIFNKKQAFTVVSSPKRRKIKYFSLWKCANRKLPLAPAECNKTIKARWEDSGVDGWESEAKLQAQRKESKWRNLNDSGQCTVLPALDPHRPSRDLRVAAPFLVWSVDNCHNINICTRVLVHEYKCNHTQSQIA